MIRIICRAKDEPERTFDEDKTEITIGRSKESTIKLDDSRLSRHHCSVVREGDTYFVIDKGSSNGTYLNYKRIQKEQLKTGDAIVVGSHALFIEQVPDDADKHLEFAQSENKPEMSKKLLDVDRKEAKDKHKRTDEPDYVLEIAEGENKGKVYHLSDQKVTLGRNDQNTITIKDQLVSNFHGEVVPENSKYYIYDLGSTNGTKLNGEKVVKAPLVVGNELQIGPTKLVFKNLGKMQPGDMAFAGKATAQAREKRLESKKSSLYMILGVAAVVAVVATVIALTIYPFGGESEPSPKPSESDVAQNMITGNADFEGSVGADASPQDWTFAKLHPSSNVFVDKQKKHGGSQSLAFKDLGSDGKPVANRVVFGNPLIVEGGKAYMASARILTSNAIGYNALQVRLFSSQFPDACVNYYTVPVSRTHAEFVESKVSFIVPEWADTAEVACFTFASRGNAWFDDVSLSSYSGSPEEPRKLEAVSGFSVGADAWGNVWVTRGGRLVALSNGLAFATDSTGDEMVTSAMLASPGKLQDVQGSQATRFTAQVFDPVMGTKHPFEAVFSTQEGMVSVNYNVAVPVIKRMEFALLVAPELSSSGVKCSVNGELTELTSGARLSGISEVVIGSGSQTLSFGFSQDYDLAYSSSAAVSKLVFARFEPAKVVENYSVAMVLSGSSSTLRDYVAQKLNIAKREMGTGSIFQAKSMYEALLKEFPENELVKREVQRGLEQFDEELKALRSRLDALESDLRSAAKTGDPEKFSAASDELNELVPLIKARARESELEERAVAVSELRDELRTQMSSRLKEQEASELLKLATDAMEEDKYVLAKAILDNVVRKYSDTPAAAKAIQSLREVETKLEEIRAAMEEWTDVLARADELVLANKKEQAKTLVLDFLAKYPGFRPAKQYLETLN